MTQVTLGERKIAVTRPLPRPTSGRAHRRASPAASTIGTRPLAGPQREEFADEILQAVSSKEGKRFALCLFRNITMFWCSLSGRDQHNFKEARDELGWAFDLRAEPAKSCPVGR
jgi:hypothetical protein